MAEAEDGAQAFAALRARFLQRPGVDLGRMLKSEAMRVGGKSFVYPTETGLVFKLPKAVVTDLEATGAGTRLVVGKRVMSEWVIVPLAGAAIYDRLAEQAYEFVGAG